MQPTSNHMQPIISHYFSPEDLPSLTLYTELTIETKTVWPGLAENDATHLRLPFIADESCRDMSWPQLNEATLRRTKTVKQRCPQTKTQLTDICRRHMLRQVYNATWSPKVKASVPMLLWKCPENHVFAATKNNLRVRDKAHQKSPHTYLSICLSCAVADHERTWDMTCIAGVTIEAGFANSLIWQCNICSRRASFSMRNSAHFVGCMSCTGNTHYLR